MEPLARPPPSPPSLLSDSLLAFTAVPQQRRRADGWTPETQASFAAAWDRAISTGRMHQYGIAMDRALNGVTIVRVLKGGAVDVSGGPDMAIVHAALRDEASPPLKATKETE